ncbi:hypothetical protein JTE90_021490 [Oedothorax gibbosus]|uniref:Uncharacterized protein n=1 Tax=Oedothorax gibbosus TaxID=931172 RepID=A0AAV6VQ83_9ARAC|nr:hypothetical protein JTE90_021490 [Oedothorax gibbosus]
MEIGSFLLLQLEFEMADPSRQISESGGRNNPQRRRSAEDRQEVDNAANPIDANNNARPNLDVDTPSPDSLIVTSTTPEDPDSNREIGNLSRCFDIHSL